MPKRSNLVDEIMVRSEYKYHTLGVWVFISCSSEGRGFDTGSYSVSDLQKREMGGMDKQPVYSSFFV